MKRILLLIALSIASGGYAFGQSTISSLSSAASLGDTNLIEVVQSGSKKATMAQVRTYVLTGLGFTDLTGSLACSQHPALTGDITTSAGACATTLATVNSNTGTFGSATKASIITVNAKGLVTAASEATVTPAVGSITGLGTNVATGLANTTNGAGGFVTADGTATLTNKTIAGSQITGAYTANGQTMATARLLGRTTASSGAVEEISIGSGLTLAAGSLSASGGSTWLRKTTTYTAASADRIRASTTAGAWSLTFPASPSDGDEITVVDIDGTFDTNPLTILANGKKVMNDSTSLIVDLRYAMLTFVYDNTLGDWRF